MAGRYYADPRSGCFWERLSGLGGTLGEVLANQFIGFDSAQEIVDVIESDLAFSSDADCGSWFTTPRPGPQGDIPPGRWLVNAQVPPGVYEVEAGPGCFWERLSHFDGTLSGTIANDFVPDGGRQLVEIAAGDVGFSSDDDCGTWMPSAAATVPLRTQSRGEIESARKQNREQQ